MNSLDEPGSGEPKAPEFEQLKLGATRTMNCHEIVKRVSLFERDNDLQRAECDILETKNLISLTLFPSTG